MSCTRATVLVFTAVSRKLEMDRVTRDYMKIEYAGGSNLYVLATQLDTLQKYASGEAAKVPKLNKIGGQEWNKTKTRVRHAVKNIAQDLVKLYAERQASSGYQFGKDTIWQKEFEELFPFEETDDQLAAIEATKADMESKKIMDRLICGDVGYGKTEGCNPCSVQGSTGEQTGRLPRSDHYSGTAALQYVR